MPHELEALKDNTVIVVFGASGDLAKRQIFPALFWLYTQSLLPQECRIVGYARSKMDQSEFERRVTSYIKDSSKDLTSEIMAFKGIVSYISGDYDSDDDFEKLNTHLKDIEAKYTGQSQFNRIFYLAVPPDVYIDVLMAVRKHCYLFRRGILRLIVEPKASTDGTMALMEQTQDLWPEGETFRIERYLAKDVVKNLFALRFANGVLFEWGRTSIANVYITLKESWGVEGRGELFDQVGIIRHVIMNHLIQLLTIIAMERPVNLSEDSIRDARANLIQSILPITKSDVLLGQYVSGNGHVGYLDDGTVPSNSNCPTFAAMALFVDNPRWKGVPFILQAGKALDKNQVEVRIQYRNLNSSSTGQGNAFQNAQLQGNELIIRIKPTEGIHLKMNHRVPGLASAIKVVSTEIDLSPNESGVSHLGPAAGSVPEYESAVLDVLRGRLSSFVRQDELENTWEVFSPTLQWIDGTDTSSSDSKPSPVTYTYGSSGPGGLTDFLKRYGIDESMY